MPAAKPSSPRPSPTRLPSLATLVAVVPGLAPGLLAQGLLALGLMALGFALGLGLLSTDATAQTRATLKVPPEPAGNTILVLDYSNSMWGQIDEVAKIEIARDIIERNLADWNQSTRLGLVAYGHRRKSDCSDIELVAAPAAQATDAMLAFLADAAPRGRTPLTSALEQAARHATDGADSESGSASLVLLTDGIESCGRDPCAAVTDLDAAGVALAVHVIGLDLDGPEAEELRCIADITGGQFLTADDAKALDAALVDTLAQPASVVLPTPRRGAETTAPVPEAVAEAEAEAEAAPVPTTEDTVKALLAEAASMRDELAALQDQMDERERRLLSAQAALSDKLADMTAKLNRSRLAGDRLRAENEQLKAAIRSLLDLSDQAAALAGDVLAPATAAAAANEARRERASKAPVADTPAAIPLAPTPETLGPPIPGDVVRISLAPGSEIPLDELRWTILPSAGSQAGALSVSGTGSTFMLPRAETVYHVLLEAWPHRQTEVIEVSASERRVHDITLNLAAVNLVDKRDGIEPVTLLFTRERGVVFETELIKTDTIFLPEGQYDVAFLQGLKSQSRKLQLIAGAEFTLTVGSL